MIYALHCCITSIISNLPKALLPLLFKVFHCLLCRNQLNYNITPFSLCQHLIFKHLFPRLDLLLFQLPTCFQGIVRRLTGDSLASITPLPHEFKRFVLPISGEFIYYFNPHLLFSGILPDPLDRFDLIGFMMYSQLSLLRHTVKSLLR